MSTAAVDTADVFGGITGWTQVWVKEYARTAAIRFGFIWRVAGWAE